MLSRIRRKGYKILKSNANYFRHRKKIRLSLLTYNLLSRYSQNIKRQSKVRFNGNPIVFGSPFWFLHSVNEIFAEEVYKFSSDKQNPYIIDCGSNIGLSVIYFKEQFPKARVVAFEADPFVFQQLQKNAGQYEYEDVSLVNAAVWYKQETLSFHSEGSVGGSINFDGSSNNHTVSVPTVRLNDYLDEEVDFLKIDIEGAEYDVLKDCKDSLQNVKNLFIEYHEEKNKQASLHEILAWVEKAGFKYYIREAWNNMSYPFTKKYNDYFHSQLNIFCFRP